MPLSIASDDYQVYCRRGICEHYYCLLPVVVSSLYAVFVNDKTVNIASSLARNTQSKKLFEIARKLITHVGKIKIEYQLSE